VAGIDPAITTLDIVRCLSNIMDMAERRVHFEIVWMDDQTFMVAPQHTTTQRKKKPTSASICSTGTAWSDSWL
jgi:hypothetical protein